MTMEDIYNDLKRRISPKRFTHIMGVTKTAEILAKRYGADPDKAYLAGLLHDCAKELPLSQMQGMVDEANVLVDRAVYENGALLHGLAGAVMARDYYGIDDEEVLEAIRVHTTGKVGMSALDKVVFLADYIEPSRKFPGVDALRKLAFIDLDEAVLAGYDSTIAHLLEQKLSIYFKTILGRNDCLAQMKRSR